MVGEPRYSAVFLDHYERPRNPGRLEGADVEVTVKEGRCGDVLQLAVRCRGGVVEAARFRAFGCAAATAVGSVTTELLVGTRVGELKGIGTARIVEALDGLPPGRVHAAGLAAAAVVELARELRAQRPRGDPGRQEVEGKE